MQTKSFSFEELFRQHIFFPIRDFKLLSMTIIKDLFKKMQCVVHCIFVISGQIILHLHHRGYRYQRHLQSLHRYQYLHFRCRATEFPALPAFRPFPAAATFLAGVFFFIASMT